MPYSLYHVIERSQYIFCSRTGFWAGVHHHGRELDKFRDVVFQYLPSFVKKSCKDRCISKPLAHLTYFLKQRAQRPDVHLKWIAAAASVAFWRDLGCVMSKYSWILDAIEVSTQLEVNVSVVPLEIRDEVS